MNVSKFPVLFKVSTCFFAGVAIVNIFFNVGLSDLIGNASFLMMLAVHVLLGALVGGIFLFLWSSRENKSVASVETLTGWLQGIIRWWLAFAISMYGFAKIFKTQFYTPPYRYDMPVGELSGFSLTWFYYGYSYPLAVIIGLLQIIGSIFLLFRSTALIGLLLLLPVMTNIVLINWFYNISDGAFVNSLLFTVGLMYMIALDFPRLMQTITGYRDTLLPVKLKSVLVKNLLRITPVIFSLVAIVLIANTNSTDERLTGAYKVDSFKRNEQVLPANAWVSDSTVFSRVYFSGAQGCAFSPNPYRYKPKESMRGDYHYDSARHQLSVVYYYGPKDKNVDSVNYSVTLHSKDNLTLKGIWKSDTLEMQLSKVR